MEYAQGRSCLICAPKLLLHGMKSLCYGDPSAFNIEAFGNQEDHRGLSLAYGDNIQTD